MGFPRRSAAQLRDLIKTKMVVVDDCWEWTASVGTGGYARQRWEGEVLAHRVSYRVFKNDGLPIEKGLVVRHSCHNRKCVNPEHLLMGTYQDNEVDKMEAGRQNPATGFKLPQTRLSEADVRDIRVRARAGEEQSSIADRYGLNQGYVSQLVNYKRRANVKDAGPCL